MSSWLSKPVAIPLAPLAGEFDVARPICRRHGHGRGAEIIFEKGIEYSNPNDQHLQLNLARPKQAEKRMPAVLCIHGGGFRAGNRDRWDKLCQQLAERGYVAATVTYRLAPKFQFPAAVH